MQNSSKPTGKEDRSKGKLIIPSLTTLSLQLSHIDPFCTQLNILEGKIYS